MKMDYINYLDEAIYFFCKLNCYDENCVSHQLSFKEFKELGINESVYKAIMRILVVNNMLDYDEKCFILNSEHIKKHKYILDSINSKNQIKTYEELFTKAINKSEFFFDSINEIEYEIYSRYNFSITFRMGKDIVRHINLTNKKVLELGGNSGGLGAAFLSRYENCSYSVLDREIPCKIGKEFKDLYNLNITFIEDDIFKLELLSDKYDYIIMMNLLHDFDDFKCLNILSNCIKYCDNNAKFLVIEDILINEFEPKEAIMRGLRLSIECRGGKQRTIKELEKLFFKINYKIEKVMKINDIHTMLIIGMQ